MVEVRVIAVSGTPGTGKTKFARRLAERMGAKMIDLNALIERRGIYELDEEGTRVTDPEVLGREFSRAIEDISGSLVVEGLLAHLLPKEKLTHVVVLRTRPKVLKKRLKERGYSGKKLRDNLEAEALDIILWEAVQAHGEDRVYELDTTELTTEEAVNLFQDALKGKVSLRPGKIDWLEDFYGP
ncbi:MAG: adenylate kinase family protein [Candidatus Hadarchaeota archaeon]|nr:adenylate kinase family protein [Candidatus Hadarchaeota archaeon]